MPRVATLTHSLSLWVYANDHAPPHFHILSPDSDAQIAIRTLRIIRGTVRRQELAAALAWVAAPGNLAAIQAEWERLHESD